MQELNTAQVLTIIAMIIFMAAVCVHIYSLILAQNKRTKYRRTGLAMIAISIITFQVANFIMNKEDSITLNQDERLYE